MSDPLIRENFIELLNKLGSERDEDVLDAARRLHENVTAAGLEWEDLLVPEQANEVEEHDTGGEPEPEEQTDETDAAPPPLDAADQTLIDELLSLPGISETLREELEAYKTDGVEAADAQYIRALHTRLTKDG